MYIARLQWGRRDTLGVERFTTVLTDHGISKCSSGCCSIQFSVLAVAVVVLSRLM